MVQKISIIIGLVVSCWCIFDLFIILSESATFLTEIRTHPDHPGKCWEDITKIALKPGNIINVENECIQIMCTKDLRFVGSSCSPMETSDNCEEVPGDLSQPYPFCCPRFKCIDECGNNLLF